MDMIEYYKNEIKQFEGLVEKVEMRLVVAIENRDFDEAHILAAAKIGLLNEIHDSKVQLFKRELSEVR